MRDQNKTMQDHYTQISDAYTRLVLSEKELAYVKENERLQRLLKMMHEKNQKTEEAYKRAMGLYKGSKSTAPTSSKASVEEHRQMQKKMEELKERNRNLSERLSRAQSNEVGTLEVPWARTSIDLHWNEEGELDNMSEDELPYVKSDWKFQKDLFKRMSLQSRRLSHYKVVVQKLDRHLFPDEVERMDQQELSAPLIKMKVKASWEDWEASHPEMLRAGYQADPRHLRSKAIMKDQLKWRLDWFKSHPETVEMYAESP